MFGGLWPEAELMDQLKIQEGLRLELPMPTQLSHQEELDALPLQAGLCQSALCQGKQVCWELSWPPHFPRGLLT